jgi:AraC family transcriptional regulator
MAKCFQPGDVRIIEIADTKVGLLEHRGDPSQIPASVRNFIAWRKQAGLPPRISATFNIWYDDPDTTPPEAFRLGLCAATNGSIGPNAFGVVASVIPGGRCAVLRSIGSEDIMRQAATFLLASWLPGSGEKRRDFPPYCRRVSLPSDVADDALVTDIFLPLRWKRDHSHRAANAEGS